MSKADFFSQWISTFVMLQSQSVLMGFGWLLGNMTLMLCFCRASSREYESQGLCKSVQEFRNCGLNPFSLRLFCCVFIPFIYRL